MPTAQKEFCRELKKVLDKRYVLWYYQLATPFLGKQLVPCKLNNAKTNKTPWTIIMDCLSYRV